MLKFAVLSSGSKANASWIGGAFGGILIDVGLSARQVLQRLNLLQLPQTDIRGILVTHEHRDHVYGLATVARKLKVPVFCSAVTAAALREIKYDLSGVQLETFIPGVDFQLAGVNVHPFSISHDAADPVGYRLDYAGCCLVHATDLGQVTPLVRERLRGADALVLESNHDLDKLWACGYPWPLKQRIASAHGHLSNHEAGQLLADICHEGLQHVVLAHLSENSNTPELALSTVLAVLSERGQDSALWSSRLRCASVAQATPILEVVSNSLQAMPLVDSVAA